MSDKANAALIWGIIQVALGVGAILAVVAFAPWLFMVFIIGWMVLTALKGGEGGLGQYGRHDGDE
ncbi:MAG: hypothetical protein KAG70_03745 [Alcanivorax sp.]|nr:hypothetical protein [Alcanivorax sp.]